VLTKRLAVTLLAVAPFLAAAAAYTGLVYDGSLPPPDWTVARDAINASAITGGQAILFFGLALIFLLAILAPIIFAIRANDAVTILISLAMTGGAITMLVISRTVMDQISAPIIFLANITLSGIVYAAHRIAPSK
jgi:hypothetical protein